jgi:hypothetical protein
MKNAIPRFALFLPAACLLAGCWTNPAKPPVATADPSFAGGIVFNDEFDSTASVTSVNQDTRQIVLTFKDGTSSTNIAGPEVINFYQIKAGDHVKAHIGVEYGIFLIKNGQPPTASSSVLFAGAAKGETPAGLMVTTHDVTAQVLEADRSYRLLTLKFADGHVKTFKVPLPYTLERVDPGDNVVLRTTDTVALRLAPQ